MIGFELIDKIRPGRVHEATGTGRRSFALALAAALTGPVIWLQETRGRSDLYPPGVAQFCDPTRLIFLRPSGGPPLLQLAEEALRSGAAPLVVCEMSEAPALTPSRRLQLAADAGGGRGLCLVPEHGLRTNAAETRWHCAPVLAASGEIRQHWELLKNKNGRLDRWTVDLAPLLRDGTHRGRAPRPVAERLTPT